MLRYCLLLFTFLMLNLGLSFSAYGQTWQVGILSLRGSEYTQRQWQPWIHWLNQTFPSEQFHLIPIDLNTLAQGANLDFILTNQAQFFYLNNQDVRWLASLSSPYYKTTSNAIGSAILVKQDSPYFTLNDLKNKQISAVDNRAFGGFLLGYYEFFKQGIKQDKDLNVIFTGFPADQTLQLLRDNRVDAAIAPVCLFEEMVKEGKLQASDFRLLATQPSEHCLTSTELLPNWSLAAMDSVPNVLASQMTIALLQQTSDQLPKWTTPFSSFKADSILRELYRHPQQKSLWEIVKDWLKLNQFSLLTLFGFLAANYLWITYQVHRKSQALEKANIAMQQYQQEFIKADRLTLLGEMTSGFAHEINQPLSAIRMYAEGLTHQTTDPYHLAILEKIIHQVDRSVAIMANIKHWVKNKGNNQQEEIHLLPLIQQVIQFISLQNRHNVSITVVNPKNYRLNINATLLEQVLANCLLNSIQAGASSIHLYLKTSADQLCITIEDNGTGFTHEQLEFPFVPFRTNKAQGLGLGLVLCQRLMQSIQGKIELANHEQGAKVTLTLPLSPQEEHV